MKIFSKRVFLIMAVCVFMMAIAISLVACGDSDIGVDNGFGTIEDNSEIQNNKLIFAEGTTLADVSTMIDSGEIKNYTMTTITGDDKIVQYISINMAYTKYINHSGCYFECYAIYDNGMVYTINADIANNQIQYGCYEATRLGQIDKLKNAIESLIEYGTEIIISGEKIIALELYYDKMEWSDFNVTNITLPSKYSNYKELASK